MALERHIIEPTWQGLFRTLSSRGGFAAHINDDVFWLAYEYGSRYDRRDRRVYEPTFYTPFVSRIREGMTVFDIGAHVGFFTVGAAKRVGRTGRVIAFEPAPETVRVLERHIAWNGQRDRAEIMVAVVSDSDGTVPFYVYGESMAASLARANVEVLNPEKLVHPAREIRVPSVSIDRLCRERGFWPDVLKIDVEGAELRVLRGARELLATRSPVIFCEVHPKQMENCDSSIGEFRSYLEGVGYGVEPLDAPNPVGIFHGVISRHA